MAKPLANTYLTTVLLLTVLTVAVGLLAACAQPEPVTDAETAEIKSALDDRSFRQFDPGVDDDPRRGVIIDFFSGVEVWAQYAEGDYAIDEWRIFASDYRIEKSGDLSNITIYLENPGSERILTEPCQDCIPMDGFSISIRNALDEDDIRFRLNDPNDVLPSPFPVFTSWTRFSEDEYFE